MLNIPACHYSWMGYNDLQNLSCLYILYRTNPSLYRESYLFHRSYTALKLNIQSLIVR